MNRAPATLQPDEPVGVIAGQGRLPMLVAEGARRAGRRVIGLSLIGNADPDFPSLCDEHRPVALLRVGSWPRILARFGVRHAVMVGRVDKAATMHDPLRLFRQIPDLTTAGLWYRRLRHDRRSPAILAALADTLAERGLNLMDSTLFIPEHLAAPGVMTRAAPTAAQRADIDFGWPILRETLRLDIGQAIAVRELDVIAVEAVEGTDRMIRRAGKLCGRRGWVLLKGARPDHDRRADVPTVGPGTVRAVHEAGGRCIALGAGDVIILDKPSTLALADELGVAMVGVPRQGPAAGVAEPGQH